MVYGIRSRQDVGKPGEPAADIDKVESILAPDKEHLQVQLVLDSTSNGLVDHEILRRTDPDLLARGDLNHHASRDDVLFVTEQTKAHVNRHPI